MTAAGAFLYLADGHRSIDHATPSQDSCKGQDASSLECPTPNPIPEPSATSAYRAGAQDLQKVAHLPNTRQRVPRRAWQQEGIASALLPGQSLAELCVDSPDAAVSDCRALTTAGLRSLTDTSDSNNEDKEPSISGRVLSADGQPLESVSLVALPERLDEEAISLSKNLRFWTVSDSLGAYSFSGLPAGEYMIRSARHGPYLPARISARNGIDYADLIMSRHLDVRIEGQVVDRFGKPLEGVTVLPMLLGQPSATTGSDGRFALPVSAKPDVFAINLRFQMAGYKEQSSKVTLSGHRELVADEIKVAMEMVESWTSLKGTVSDDGGQPLPGRRVELRPKAGGQTQSTTTDEKGVYTFAFVEAPANYRLVVSGGSGFKDVKQDITVTTTGKEFNVATERFETGAVVGQLVNQHGAPIADFEFLLKNVDSIEPSAVVRTDRLGNFKIPDVPAGDLVISSVSTPSVLIKGLRLEPGEQIHVSMVLDWGDHSIRGQVVDSTGIPVPASRVVLNWSHREETLDMYTTRRTATDSEGRFAFSNLGPGPHSLKVDAPGFLSVDIDHDLIRQGYDLTVKMN
jgi:protocatechuate 3,4-dioxygenase beta subunit